MLARYIKLEAELELELFMVKKDWILRFIWSKKLRTFWNGNLPVRGLGNISIQIMLRNSKFIC